jgi:predicted glycosyltransferase
MGLGHTRRNLLIAERLASRPCRASVLVITGSRASTAYRARRGIDYLTLPGLHKRPDGVYETRSLGVDFERLIQLRAASIRSALEAFAPDVLIVDKLPRGAFRELDPSLSALAGRTRFVLGLRDVLDDPETVRREWERDATAEAIDVHYDAVWIYGDPTVYDLVGECALSSSVAAKVRYTGYLNARARLHRDAARSAEIVRRLDLPAGPTVLCQLGGGQDGLDLALTFADAELPPATNAVLLTGPFMPAKALRQVRSHAARDKRKRVVEFVTAPGAFLCNADRVVSMGGYNSICEILSLGKRALIVPRVRPRREQMIRAERLCALGLVDVLHPDRLAVDAMAEWLHRDPPPAPAAATIDFGGLRRLSDLLRETAGQAEPVAATGARRRAVGF